ncbi:MAG: urease accessory UreF family protein [Gordonia sp. (in: high G+C Gram-positive bacteria)]|uniref:urease accessory UreF family protein n=1 Tax=Gordonia sp. (in: high G+C Gram-positive bacteria) TaxID=84139 RepID=UPI0039E2A819
MLLADARLPTGGHAYSAGVEPALRGGLPPERIREYLIGRAGTVTRTEAGTAAVARAVLSTGSRSGPERSMSASQRSLSLSQRSLSLSQRSLSLSQRSLSLSKGDAADRVQAAWAARTPAPALREASIAQARGYLRFARSQWPEHPALAAVDQMAAAPCRPVVLGAVAVAAGIAAPDLVRLAIYDDAATACAAVLKLEPQDPAVVSGWVLDACAAGEPFVAALAALTDPDAIPAPGAPQTEEWAQAHAVMTQRLFRA